MENGNPVLQLLREGNTEEAIRTVENLIRWDPDNYLWKYMKCAIQIASGILQSEESVEDDGVFDWLHSSKRLIVDLNIVVWRMNHILNRDVESWVRDVFKWFDEVSCQFSSTVLAVEKKLFMSVSPPCDMDGLFCSEPPQPLNFLISPTAKNDFPADTPDFDIMFPSM